MRWMNLTQHVRIILELRIVVYSTSMSEATTNMKVSRLLLLLLLLLLHPPIQMGEGDAGRSDGGARGNGDSTQMITTEIADKIAIFARTSPPFGCWSQTGCAGGSAGGTRQEGYHFILYFVPLLCASETRLGIFSGQWKSSYELCWEVSETLKNSGPWRPCRSSPDGQHSTSVHFIYDIISSKIVPQ